jgi:hypothetical protein
MKKFPKLKTAEIMSEQKLLLMRGGQMAHKSCEANACKTSCKEGCKPTDKPGKSKINQF